MKVIVGLLLLGQVFGFSVENGDRKILLRGQQLWATPEMMKTLSAQNIKFTDITENSKTKLNGPLVVTTWPQPAFQNATQLAFDTLVAGPPGIDTIFDAMIAGCQALELDLSVGNVGWGGNPDSNGETTLDALLVDGNTLNTGAVMAIRRIKEPMAVARLVLENTAMSQIAGDFATTFATEFGGKEEGSITTDNSYLQWANWLDNTCQPNFWRNVDPDPTTSCGPFRPAPEKKELPHSSDSVTFDNHDTVSMVIVDIEGNIAAGSTTNGLRFKIPGRVGDSPVVGAGAYADSEAGGCGATGDGDVMVRFLPCYQAVENMRNGMNPTQAAQDAISRISRHYPNFNGAIIVADRAGEYGAATHGYSSFDFSVTDAITGVVRVERVFPHDK